MNQVEFQSTMMFSMPTMLLPVIMVVLYNLVSIDADQGGAVNVSKRHRENSSLQIDNQLQFECCLHSNPFNPLEPISMLFSKYQMCQKYIGANVTDRHYRRTLVTILLNQNNISILHKINNVSLDSVCNVVTPNTCEKKTKPWYRAYVAFWTLTFLTAFVGNCLVCIAYKVSRTLRQNVAYLFVCSLAVSDLLVCLFIIPVKISESVHNQHFCASLGVCRMLFTTDVTFFVASITNLFAVTVDRYIATTKPYIYKTTVTLRRAKIVVSLVWIYAAIWGLFVHYSKTSHKFDDVQKENNSCIHENHYYFMILYVTVFFIPCFTMGCLYTQIHRVALNHARCIQKQREQIRHLTTTDVNQSGRCSTLRKINKMNILRWKSRRQSPAESTGSSLTTCTISSNRRIEWKATKVILVVNGTFLICWLPCVIIFIIQQIHGIQPSIYIYIVFAEILPLFHSTSNPFIYAIFHRDFKKALSELMARLFPQWRQRHLVCLNERSHQVQAELMSPNHSKSSSVDIKILERNVKNNNQ